MRKVELLPTWDCEAGYGPVQEITDSQTPITPLSRPKTGAVHLTRRGSTPPPKKRGEKGKERKEKEKGKEKERHKETKMS